MRNRPSTNTDPSGCFADDRVWGHDKSLQGWRNYQAWSGSVKEKYYEKLWADQEKVDAAVKRLSEYASKNSDLAELLKNAKAAAGGEIFYVADATIPRNARWDVGRKSILINVPQLKDPDLILGKILFELINAKNTAKFKAISDDARKGNLSRIDFVVLYEKVEYDGLASHHKIAKAGVDAKEWSKAVDMYAGYHGVSFAKFLENQIEVDRAFGKAHAAVYGENWSRKRHGVADAWFMKNKGGNPDLIVDIRVKALEGAVS